MPEEEVCSQPRRQLRSESKPLMVLLFVLIITTAVVPLLLWSFDFGWPHKEALLSFSLIATPMVTFFGFIWLGEYLLDIEPALGVVRTALTAAIVSAYFVLLGLTIFIAGEETQFPLQEQLVNSFTTIVGVLIAFYFGASVYSQVKK